MANKTIGIDVSVHNGTLDWAKIKAAGIAFAIIRTGYGVSSVDSTFKANINGAIDNGIAVGVYHFSYALNAEGAKREAQQVLNIIKPYKDKITLPVFFDFEYDTVDYAKRMGVTLGKQAFNDHTVAFCEVIKAAGYTPGVYYNLDYYNRFVDYNRLKGYVQWYAQYASKVSAKAPAHAIWQYSSSGTITGHACRFDMNELKDAALLKAKSYTEGWVKNDTGWWYQLTDGSWVTSQWKKINGKWYYFKEDGYMASNAWVAGTGSYTGHYFYVGEDGAPVTNRALRLDADGKLVPGCAYYARLGDVPAVYRTELDALVEAGKLKGKGGEGDDMILDMTEDAVRVLIVTNR